MTIGVAILSFNRPQYLSQLLASLEAQTDLDGFDFHLFQDGAVNRFSGVEWAKQEDIDLCIALFCASQLPNKTIHVSDDNIGIALNVWRLMDHMSAHYERIMQIQDDIKLSPYWFRMARHLYADLEQRPGVFSFSPCFKRKCRPDEINDSLGRLVYTRHHWWCECYTANGWYKILDHFLEYMTLVKGVDNNYRPHDEIHALYKSKGWPGKATSEDNALGMSCFLADLLRAEMVVNRGLYIGEQGVHWSPENYKRAGWKDQLPYKFDNDITRSQFDWPPEEIHGKRWWRDVCNRTSEKW